MWLWNAAILLFDWFQTAVIPVAERQYVCFVFSTNNELRCGQHEMFCKLVAKGMRLCERVPPDPTVAMALFATRVPAAVHVPVGRFYRFLRCLQGTQDDNFGYSVNNPRMKVRYADAPMAVKLRPSLAYLCCVENGNDFSTDLMSAWQQQCLGSIMTDFLNSFWMTIFLSTLEYDPRRQILYRNWYPTIPGSYVTSTFGDD